MGSNSYNSQIGEQVMEINQVLNELLVELFRDINTLEEHAVRTDEFKDLTTNDAHVIEAIGVNGKSNMTSVARKLSVTTGTLTISVNSLVKKGYVGRERSEEDRRVVLVSLTEKGRKAFFHHEAFHQNMITDISEELSEEEKQVLAKALGKLNIFFKAKR